MYLNELVSFSVEHVMDVETFFVNRINHEHIILIFFPVVN